MKVLSVRQPWAWLITHPDPDNPGRPYKDIENRSWRTHYRGPVLIHAGGTLARGAYDLYQTLLDCGIPIPEEVDAAGIVGMVDIVDCVTASDSDWFEPGGFGFVLRNPRPLPFFECKGKLNLYDIPDNELPRTLRESIARG